MAKRPTLNAAARSGGTELRAVGLAKAGRAVELLGAATTAIGARVEGWQSGFSRLMGGGKASGPRRKTSKKKKRKTSKKKKRKAAAKKKRKAKPSRAAAPQWVITSGGRELGRVSASTESRALGAAWEKWRDPAVRARRA